MRSVHVQELQAIYTGHSTSTLLTTTTTTTTTAASYYHLLESTITVGDIAIAFRREYSLIRGMIVLSSRTTAIPYTEHLKFALP